jgi:hypothetical protein
MGARSVERRAQAVREREEQDEPHPVAVAAKAQPGALFDIERESRIARAA